jgi:hypothetical protein
MTIIEYYVKQLKSYFLNKNLLHITAATVLIVYLFFLLINLYFPSEYIFFIYWNLVYSFFIYFSMIIIVRRYCFFLSKGNSVNIDLTIKKMIFIFIIKLIWNAFYIIILDSNYVSNSFYKTFFPLITIFFTWLCIYFAACFYIPSAYFRPSKKISFHGYIVSTWYYLVGNIFVSCIYSLGLIYLFTYLLKLFSAYIIYLKMPSLHTNIEILVNIVLKIVFAHLITVMNINSYYYFTRR